MANKKPQAMCSKNSIEGYSVLQEELKTAKKSILTLNNNLAELNQRKADVMIEMQQLQERISEKDANSMVQTFLLLLESLKTLERQESDFELQFKARHSTLQAEVNELKELMLNDKDEKFLSFDFSLHETVERLNSARKELAAKLREVVLLKRKFDDIPSQAELIQYERRFSELNFHIQGKLHQTRKYYATFNALLEIKELMLKEISLLNSLSSQFHDVITSSNGRMKLIDSMEVILKGIQQKLEKVQLALETKQKVCNAARENYVAGLSEQRRCYSLLKVFQDECAKNERLRRQTADV